MANNPWQHRIQRAEQLGAQHYFAADILGFYVHVARFQQGFYERVSRASVNRTPISQSAPLELPELLLSFPSFLSLVEQKAPVRLAEIAHEMRGQSSASWLELLTQCWSNTDSPDDPAEFVALAFLQPYAEFVRSQAQLQLGGYNHMLCPFCNRKAAVGILRQQGDGARRNLLCGFCLSEWEFRRIVCSGCGLEDQAKLPVYIADQFPHMRVEACDACKIYVKSVDLTKNGLANPLVDELASIPLDLWAQERGYAKVRPNLLGM